jgi:hypothetical protein
VNGKWASPLIGWSFGPGLVYPWVRYYPNLDAALILTPAVLNHYQEIAVSGCLIDPLPAIVNPQMGAFFSKDPASDPAWRKAMIANQASLPPDGVPVFIGPGLADTLIDPSLSTRLASRYCDSGANEGDSQHAKRGASNVLSICSSSMATHCVASSVRYSNGNSVSHSYRCQEAACAS